MKKYFALFPALAWLAWLPTHGALASSNGPGPGPFCQGGSLINVQSMTSVTTSGGNSLVKGTNFPTRYGTIGYANVGGVNVMLKSIANPTCSGGTCSVTLSIPALAAGTYDVTLFANDCGGQNVKTLLQVKASADPGTVGGAGLKWWHRWDTGTTCTSGCSDGNTLTAITDKSTNAINLNSGAGCTFHTGNTHFQDINGVSQPFCTFNGSSQTLSPTTQPSMGTTTAYMCVVGRLLTTPSTSNVPAMYFAPPGANNELGFAQTSNAPFLTTSNGSTVFTATGAGNLLSTSVALCGYNQGTAANAETLGVSYNNLAVANTSGTNAEIGTGAGPLSLASNNGASPFLNVEIAEDWAFNFIPTTTQLQQLQAYVQNRYSVEMQLAWSPNNVTSIQGGLSGATGRLYGGGGFNSSASVTVGGSAVTAIYKSSTLLDLTGFPSLTTGTAYPVTISTANNGASITVVNGLTPKAATTDPYSACGIKIVADYDAVNATCSGGCTNGASVTGISDASQLGQNVVQGTGANQPTWTAADASYNNLPSIATAASQYLVTFALSPDQGNSHDFIARGVAKITDTSANRGLFYFAPNGQTWLQTNATASAPTCNFSSVTAAWGVNVGTTNMFEFSCSNHGTASSAETIAVNVANGTPVSTSGSITELSWPANATFQIVDNGQGLSWIGSLARFLVLDTLPSASPMPNCDNDLHTYLSTRY